MMNIPAFSFETFKWDDIPKEEHKGISGTAYWQIRYLDTIRVRRVEYSAGYFADHWCKKGHVLFCVQGEMTTELEDGRQFILSKGMCYLVGDNCEAHRSRTENGCVLYMVD